MPSHDEVMEQIKSLDSASQFLGKKEIKELPSILWHDEVIKEVAQGMYDNSMGLIVATDRRVIFVDKGFFGGLKVEDFAYDKISSIQYETGILTGSITIFTSSNKAKITQVEKDRVRNLAEAVRHRISGNQPAQVPQSQAAPAADGGDRIAALERLAKLKEQGILDDAEFKAEKAKILGS